LDYTQTLLQNAAPTPRRMTARPESPQNLAAAMQLWRYWATWLIFLKTDVGRPFFGENRTYLVSAPIEHGIVVFRIGASAPVSTFFRKAPLAPFQELYSWRSLTGS
jgi:hypothetical protein